MSDNTGTFLLLGGGAALAYYFWSQHAQSVGQSVASPGTPVANPPTFSAVPVASHTPPMMVTIQETQTPTPDPPPEIIPAALHPVISLSGLAGLGDYVPRDPCPYPPIVAQWESIPESQIASFVPEGWCPGDCFHGLGAFMDGSGLFGTGLFAGGMDFSTWGPGEYIAASIAAYMVFGLVSDVVGGTKRVARGVRRARSRSRRRASLRKQLAES